MEESDEAAKPLVLVLANVLDRLVATNSGVGDRTITKFSAAKRPAISISDYLDRIHKYARCSTSCFVLALVYIDRLIQRDNFVLNDLNVHRVVITSMMIAAKFFDDLYFNNAFYARVGGIPTKELNELEVDFLLRVNFSVRVTPADFERYNKELLAHAEQPPAVDGAAAMHIEASVPHGEADTSPPAPEPPATTTQEQEAHPMSPPAPPCDSNAGAVDGVAQSKPNGEGDPDVGLVRVYSGGPNDGAGTAPDSQNNGNESWPIWSTLMPVRQQS